LNLTRVAGMLLAASLTLQTVGCAATRRPFDVTDEGIRFPERSAVMFFVDGLNGAVLDEMLTQGRLPSIQRWFVERGIHVDGAVSSLPPITYANSTSIITGLFPGHHGILGNKWFDRHALVLRDYGSAGTYRTVNEHITAPTIFDVLSDQLTINVQNHTRRGAAVSIDRTLASGISWLTHRYSDVDQRVGDCMSRIHRLAAREGRWPVLVMNYFPGVDEIGHRFGPDSPQYRDAIRVVDGAVAKVLEAHARGGLLDRTYFVLLTDHGMVQTVPDRAIDFNGWLERRFGWRVFETRLDPDRHEDNQARLKEYDAVVINGAWRRAAIHLPGPCGWSCRPTADELMRILDAPPNGATGSGIVDLDAVAVVCLRLGPDAVHVVSKKGRATVERRMLAGRNEYRLTPDIQPSATAGPIDALGYSEDPRLAAFIASGWHASRDWLAATNCTAFPDFVPQVVEMFDSPRSGDLVVFAAEGWSLANGMLGGHGSCLAEDMLIPVYLMGPDLPHGGRISHARLVDVMPTVIDLLGFGDRLKWLERLDGTSIAARLKASAGTEPRAVTKP